MTLLYVLGLFLCSSLSAASASSSSIPAGEIVFMRNYVTPVLHRISWADTDVISQLSFEELFQLRKQRKLPLFLALVFHKECIKKNGKTVEIRSLKNDIPTVYEEDGLSSRLFPTEQNMTEVYARFKKEAGDPTCVDKKEFAFKDPVNNQVIDKIMYFVVDTLSENRAVYYIGQDEAIALHHKQPYLGLCNGVSQDCFLKKSCMKFLLGKQSFSTDACKEQAVNIWKDSTDTIFDAYIPLFETLNMSVDQRKRFHTLFASVVDDSGTSCSDETCNKENIRGTMGFFGLVLSNVIMRNVKAAYTLLSKMWHCKEKEFTLSAPWPACVTRNYAEYMVSVLDTLRTYVHERFFVVDPNNIRITLEIELFTWLFYCVTGRSIEERREVLTRASIYLEQLKKQVSAREYEEYESYYNAVLSYP